MDATASWIFIIHDRLCQEDRAGIHHLHSDPFNVLVITEGQMDERCSLVYTTRTKSYSPREVVLPRAARRPRVPMAENPGLDVTRFETQGWELGFVFIDKTYNLNHIP